MALEQGTSSVALSAGSAATARAGGDRWRAVKPYGQVAAFAVAVAVLAPAMVDARSSERLVNLWLVYSAVAVGFYWVFGLAGRFAFSHTFMMALGAYSSAWFTRHGDGRPMLAGVVVAAVVAGLVAAIIGLLLHRSEGFYFAIATLSVTQVGFVVFSRWTDFTGPNGVVVGVSPISLGGRRYVEDTEVFWLFLVILTLLLFAAVFIERSPLRRRAIAARDNAIVAGTLGLPVLRVQLTLFVLGSVVAAGVGAFTAHWTGFVSTESFGLELAIGVFLMVVLGGAHSMWGPVLGAAFYVALPEILSGFERYQTIIYGGVLLVAIVAVPEGLIGLGGQLRRRLSRLVQSTRHTRSRPSELGDA